MAVPEGIKDFLKNPDLKDQLQGLMSQWQTQNPGGYQRIADQAHTAWNSYGPSLMSEWQKWPSIASFDMAAGAPQNIYQDLYKQSPYTARFVGDIFANPKQTTPGVPQTPNVHTQVPQVGAGNASQAPGLVGAAAGLDQQKKTQAQPAAPGQGNEPLAGIGRPKT